MTTINISLPDKLKAQAELLIAEGYFASFSDLVRHSVRQTIDTNKYDLMAEEAKKDLESGEAITLESTDAIDEYLNSI